MKVWEYVLAALAFLIGMTALYVLGFWLMYGRLPDVW